ncbi:MAG: hypothetical protein M0Z77_05940 [Thermoplasmatales archaeon]|jgi:hypothetical protein|nr:hypothetical protein [Candidatus Thermoplasmatota archaeon]MDA8055177.1 hypothetical protein [Thermoplasmatales archaeon]
MWEGLTGKRRKNGLYGMLIGIVVSAILLYLSFYISFLYLLIPILLLVIFHYTKAWRFSDRAFYGFIAIVVAFFLAMGGISNSLTSAPHETTAALTISSTTYDIHFGYYNSSGNYIFNFTLPTKNITNSAKIDLIDLFTNTTLSTTNITFATTGTNYTYSLNAGQLSSHAYVVYMTLHVLKNNTTVNQIVEFLGPVLIPTINVVFLLAESLILSYLLITFLFFLAFAFFARALSMSRQRKKKEGDQNPPIPTDQPVQDTGQQRTGWFGRRNS